jgi:tRNA threonylcarbamoyladenosine dehydratase
MSLYERTEILIGQHGVHRLKHSHVLVAGLGGVGGACAESLCRSGVGTITLVDFDDVKPSNINRQIVALHSTIGKPKAEVMATRLQDINPHACIHARREFIDEGLCAEISQTPAYDFIADCIDSIHYKSRLIAACLAAQRPIISAMGAGGKLDPSRIKVSRLDKTCNDPLARNMRKALRNLKSSLKVPVVYSDEPSIKALPHEPVDGNDIRPSGRARATNGAIAHMTNMFGFMMAGVIINQLLQRDSY